jgi:hypothetical protein
MGILDRLNRAVPGRTQAARPITLVKGSGPAVGLDTVVKAGVSLAKKYDAAGASLSKAGLLGIRAEAVLVLDHSLSMKSGYRSGMVQTLVDRALGFALQVDGDGRIPVVPFDTRLWPTVEVTLNNYAAVVDREIFRPHQMGGTYLGQALDQIVGMAKTATSPLFVTIVTDDDPSDRPAVVSRLKELRRYAVFIKVLTLVPAPFWSSMDDLEVPGLIDNLDAKQITDPAGMPDSVFTDIMVDEWPSWVQAATTAGILV